MVADLCHFVFSLFRGDITKAPWRKDEKTKAKRRKDESEKTEAKRRKDEDEKTKAKRRKRKDEKTKAKRRKDESEKTLNSGLHVFVISLFRLRYFVMSPSLFRYVAFVISSFRFRLFAFVFSSFRYGAFVMSQRNNEKTKWHKSATIVNSTGMWRHLHFYQMAHTISYIVS